MYARLVLFSLGSGMRSKAEEIMEEMSPRAKARKGFKSANFLSNEADGEYGVFILWDTKQDAEDAKEALLPILQSKLTGVAKNPPSLKLFEVYQPKA